MANAPLITVEAFNALAHEHIPVAAFLGITALEIGAGTSLLRLPYTRAALRPGGVICGPALMALADLASYAAVMSVHGHDPRVLSSDLAMNFLRRVPEQDLLGRCTVLDADARRALARTEIMPASGEAKLVCLVTVNYAIPLR